MAPATDSPCVVAPDSVNEPIKVVAPLTPNVESVVTPATDSPCVVAPESVNTLVPVIAPAVRVPNVVSPETSNDAERVVAPATVKPWVVAPESVSDPINVVAPLTPSVESVVIPVTDSPVVESETSPEREPAPSVTIIVSCSSTPTLEKYEIGFVVVSVVGPVTTGFELYIKAPVPTLAYKYPPLVGNKFAVGFAVAALM